MSESQVRKKPELMSPAGHWPQLEAAVSAGADAVYFGLQHFSARAKVGFALNELNDIIGYLHRHAVKGFVTFNTLVFDHEMRQAAEAIATIARAGCDAIIVQDIGIAKIARQIAPGLQIHGSTQMSVTSVEGVELAAALGCSRVVLGRELSIADIRKIAAASDVELEVFVHGALCVSYSGQCFSSEAWGGRSANRGKCAQACRLSYDLIVDGQPRDLGEYRYLLSPGDLYALEQIPELIDIGIACFKIEGRYKSAEYVALTTRAYREAIDACFDNNQTTAQTVSKTDLEQIYSRGLGPHFISGVNHQSVVVGRVPRHRGLRVGRVFRVEAAAVVVQWEHEISPGDGLVFDSASWRSPDLPEEGGNVFEIEALGSNQVRLKFGRSGRRGRGDVDFNRIRPGDLVFRTNSPSLNKTAANIAKQAAATTALRFDVIALPGRPLQVKASTPRGEFAEFIANSVLAMADSQPLNEQLVQQQLSRLGGTPFHLDAVQLTVESPVFCPTSLLNRARRFIVEQLVRQREHVADAAIQPFPTDQPPSHQRDLTQQQPQLHLLVRNAHQLDAAIALNPASITLDYLELYGLRPSVQRIKDHGIEARVASPRILKPSEQKVVRFLLSLNCTILIRSGGLLHDLITNFRDSDGGLPEMHGDFSLNAANTIACCAYLDLGITRITPTHDLNARQIQEIAATVDPSAVEVVVFHHLPVFHTEHCVFCRYLSEGTDHTNCGHPCETHTVSLRDANGRRHAVLADVGCRNTVFGAEAQAATHQLDPWIRSGIRHFRVEFVHQSERQVTEIGTAFKQFFAQQIDSTELTLRLNRYTDQGITDGSLFVPKGFKQLVQLS